MKRLQIDVVAFAKTNWKEKLEQKPHLLLDVRDYIGRGKFRGGKDSLHNKQLYDRIMKMKGAKDCLEYLVQEIDKLLIDNPTVYVVVGCTKGKHRSVVIGLALKDHYSSLEPTLICHYVK
jgi:RNase adaptor protein for sRNA GlmZ degradation